MCCLRFAGGLFCSPVQILRTRYSGTLCSIDPERGKKSSVTHLFGLTENLKIASSDTHIYVK